MRMFQALRVGLLLIVFSVTASAQWINHRDPRIPRTADGKPNLKAPAPKLADGTPDFSGIWRAPDRKILANLRAGGTGNPMQTLAEQLYKERLANHAKDRPRGRCLPPSVKD